MRAPLQGAGPSLPLRCASSPYSTVCLSRAPCGRGASTLSVRQAISETVHQLTRDRMKELGEEIDAIDDQILSLLNRRAQAVIEVGKIKMEQNLRYYVPEREVEILRRLTASNPGPFPAEALKSIYREIISASLALEQPFSVGFLGPRASFTHMAR